MNICHGAWVPNSDPDFDNYGQFIFWVETSHDHSGQSAQKADVHPNHLSDPGKLDAFLSSDLSFRKPLIAALEPEPAVFYATLPSAGDEPLPSHEMVQLTGAYLPDDYVWRTWEIHGIAVRRPLLFLRELQFIAALGRAKCHVSSDLGFWMQYARQLRNVVHQHQFLPVMKCQRAAGKGSRRKLHTGWSPVAGIYERGLRDFSASMPPICKVVSGRKPDPDIDELDRVSGMSGMALLKHFSEQQVDRLVADTAVTKQMLKQLGNSWIVAALSHTGTGSPEEPADTADLTIERWKQWRSWLSGILGRSNDGQEAGFVLGIRLHQGEEHSDNDWRLTFFVASGLDPSLRIDLADWWDLPERKRIRWLKEFGQQFERNLLVNLGHAARICPLLWQGIESAHPTGLEIDLQTAYAFLKDDALVLESAGFKILLPSWWTPEGRKRARIRIRASLKSDSSGQVSAGTGYFSLPSLVEYKYELSIDGEAVNEQEWQDLINAKSPLVRFRGEWMELNSQQMSDMLALWRQQEVEDESSTLGSMLKRYAEADEDTSEFTFDEVLGRIMQGLHQQVSIESLDDPVGLRGQLRPYQKKGLSWLTKLESMGLNPCLADDMGLGKTIQIIALLLHERERLQAGKESAMPPTLLVAPTSVLTNWQKEIQKFAPQLKSIIHHGSNRVQEQAAFQGACDAQDIVITSFQIARRDKQLLNQYQWRRIVLDEAQNIKNPKSAQAKAIFSLDAPYRIALTGTPIENRLMDLWAIFNYLNPGYLGTVTQFRRAYEIPIQRDSDEIKSRLLHQLVHPFILRRLKTDRSIIDDLPEKQEQKVYCNLTKEQASLYQAVVNEVQKQIDGAEGIQRKGLILSTLMKLKQICNHPAQFLQDGSPFTEVRSHKLARVNQMMEEALRESDSLLVFTQFTEVGHQLDVHLRQRHGCPVYYLHGGTSRKRRQQMIETFQDPDSMPGIFILSLKAGGVGITLTRANHVFHFDRWWNPAVENQATDRAYRIGQKKTVFAHKMVTVGTLEERIDSMIEEKRSLAESIVGTGTDTGWLTEMDNADFRQLIQLNRTAIMEA